MESRALILAAHGERGGERSNASLHAHAERLSRAVPLLRVEVGLLRGSPTLEEALGKVRSCARVHLLPFLMSEGYFTDKVIPSRLPSSGAGERLVLHAPLGLSKALGALAGREAGKCAERLGLRARQASVLVAGHGAKSNRRAREAIEAHAEALRRSGAFAEVGAAFLEEPPFLDEALSSLSRPGVVAGMFVSDGLHAGEDIPRAIERSAKLPVAYTGALGAHPGICRIILEALAARGLAAPREAARRVPPPGFARRGN